MKTIILTAVDSITGEFIDRVDLEVKDDNDLVLTSEEPFFDTLLDVRGKMTRHLREEYGDYPDKI